jgi:ribonuclease P protein subunit POP4
MTATFAFIQTEFIGLNAKVAQSTNPTCVGISGRVVDETRNTLVIRHMDQKKTIVKNVAVFNFTMSDGTIVEVDGKVILGRPEDRVKKRVRRRW